MGFTASNTGVLLERGPIPAVPRRTDSKLPMLVVLTMELALLDAL